MKKALAVTLFLWFGAACGTTAKVCSPSTCTGCCDEAGECNAGTGLLECGSGGAACVACPVDQQCRAGSCALFDDAGYDASFPPDPDAGMANDSGVYDASRPDSGYDAGVDAGPPDSGTPDAGRPDGGSDAGRPDAGPADAGFDAGRPDAGPADAGPADAGPPDAGIDAGVDAGFLPDGGVSFALHVQPVFNRNCVSCHTAAHSTGLNLTAGNSYALLVNVTTVCDTLSKRVVPGDTAASMLWRKTKPMNPCNNQPMPFGSAGLGITVPADFQIIETWIAQGAPNN